MLIPSKNLYLLHPNLLIRNQLTTSDMCQSISHSHTSMFIKRLRKQEPSPINKWLLLTTDPFPAYLTSPYIHRTPLYIRFREIASFPIYIFCLNYFLSPFESISEYVRSRITGQSSPHDPFFTTETGKGSSSANTSTKLSASPVYL